MAKNLNHQDSAGTSSCYSGLSANCDALGRLYDWQTARAACPSGWHLPDTTECGKLTTFVGGASVAGTALQAKIGWSRAGKDTYGFTALPGGFRFGSSFYSKDSSATWWTSTPWTNTATRSGSRAMLEGMDYQYSNMIVNDMDQSYGYSVRCLKD